ncbi:hypothetical protein K488DRAFT_87372 [Vararia minispora EC-137]|uniref:Uncharacterized protein n=1 Tax=Vararia minispora EC-137 TaxID=1314806 RepID=A0ACB8QHT9_9AGAM|nr:hypothetical protein K488DRAFT_87372 [Vararia minispora EC-137]
MSDRSKLSSDGNGDESGNGEGMAKPGRKRGVRSGKPGRKALVWESDGDDGTYEVRRGEESDCEVVYLPPPPKRCRTTMVAELPHRTLTARWRLLSMAPVPSVLASGVDAMATATPMPSSLPGTHVAVALPVPHVPTPVLPASPPATRASSDLASPAGNIPVYSLTLTVPPHALPRSTLRNVPRAGMPRHTLWHDPDQNPCLPAQPGMPGSLICDRTDFALDDVYSLWVKRPGAVRRAWMYYGDFALQREDVMSPEEFRRLPKKRRDTWVKALLTSRKVCYVAHLARAWLHKHGRTAAPADVQRITEDLLPMKAKKPKGEKKKADPRYCKGLTTDDVHDSLWRDIVSLGVITLKCVGYSHEPEAELRRLAATLPRQK